MDGSNLTLGINSMVNMNSTMTLWTGDVSNSGLIKFSGSNNDGNIIKDIILMHPNNGFGSSTFTITSQIPNN